jgi:hypothetical protein
MFRNDRRQRRRGGLDGRDGGGDRLLRQAAADYVLIVYSLDSSSGLASTSTGARGHPRVPDSVLTVYADTPCSPSYLSAFSSPYGQDLLPVVPLVPVVSCALKVVEYQCSPAAPQHGPQACPYYSF